MGLASPEEMAELEALCREHPEIRRALEECEATMEQAAMSGAEAPPDRVREQLLSTLDFGEPGGAKMISLSSSPRGSSWKWAAAAAIVLLAISGALNVYFYSQYREANSAYANLLSQTETLQANNKVIQARLDEMQNGMAVMMNPDVQKVPMPGVGDHAQYTASVYWNRKTSEVFLSPGTLPTAPAGRQYQLWAIVDGKPVDAGMLDRCEMICKMKNFSSASAFAITLEPSGGRPEPSMDQLYVLGQTSS